MTEQQDQDAIITAALIDTPAEEAAHKRNWIWWLKRMDLIWNPPASEPKKGSGDKLEDPAEVKNLKEVEVLGWLGKIHFRYRRVDKLVLMTTQIYLVRALGDTDDFGRRCVYSRIVG